MVLVCRYNVVFLCICACSVLFGCGDSTVQTTVGGVSSSPDMGRPPALDMRQPGNIDPNNSTFNSTTPTGVTVESLAPQIAQLQSDLVCELAFGCPDIVTITSLLAARFGTKPACSQGISGMFRTDGEIQETINAVNSGRATINQDKVNECIAALEALRDSAASACLIPKQITVGVPACDALYNGTIPQDGTCTVTAECQPGLTCQPGSGQECGGTCKPSSECFGGCPTGQYCDASNGSCKQTKANGEACQSPLECGEGLLCGLNMRCEVPGPSMVPTQGSPCELQSFIPPPCSAGLVCTNYVPNNETSMLIGTCSPPGSMGAGCLLDFECASDLRCITDGESPQGTCGPLAAIGQPCDDDLQCATGSECVNGSCTTIQPCQLP